MEVYINGKCLTSQRLNYIHANAGGGQAHLIDSQTVHALVGTPPFLRKFAWKMRWKIASLYLIEEPLNIESIQKAMQLQPHNIGNLQVNLCILIKIIF